MMKQPLLPGIYRWTGNVIIGLETITITTTIFPLTIILAHKAFVITDFEPRTLKNMF